MCIRDRPQLICILAAAAFVRASHKIAAGFLLILFLFLISPFREQIVWTKAEVPVIVQAWNAFQRLFHILYQNGEWGVDVQYGLQTESFRLQIEPVSYTHLSNFLTYSHG